MRIVAAFLAALLASLGAQSWLIAQQRDIARSTTLVTRGYLPLAKIVERLGHEQERVDTDVERLWRGEPRPAGDRSVAQIFGDKMGETLREGEVHATFLRSVADRPDEQATLRRIDDQLDLIGRLFDDWRDDSDALVLAVNEGRTEDSSSLRQDVLREGTQLGDEIDTLGRLVDANVEQLAESTEAAQSRAAVISVSLAALAGLIGMSLVVAVLYALAPIGRLTAAAERMARGEPAGRIDARGGDEIAVLAQTFETMVASIAARDRDLQGLSRYLASVLDSLEDALVVVENGRITLANPAAREAWGATVGESVTDPLAGLTSGRHLVQGADRTLHDIRVHPFGDHGVIVVSSDVTEATRTREKLARSERLAVIGQMLAQVSHEVRNPLNALSLNAEMLADEVAGLDPGKKTQAGEMLGTIASEIDRLTRVTNHYLTLARKPPAEPKPEDFGQIVDEIKRLVDAELREKGIELDTRVASIGPRPVDSGQLKQAILNVVRNAAEAGAQHVSIGVDGDADEVCVEIRDDGPGMSEAELQKAGEPFYSTKATGTGLGLAITRQIVEDHGGALRIRSEPGSGTAIAIVLPGRAGTPV